MKPCANYNCETNGKLLAQSMFYPGSRYCKKCKDASRNRHNAAKGTLRARMEAKGRNLTRVGSRTCEI